MKKELKAGTYTVSFEKVEIDKHGNLLISTDIGVDFKINSGFYFKTIKTKSKQPRIILIKIKK